MMVRVFHNVHDRLPIYVRFVVLVLIYVCYDCYYVIDGWLVVVLWQSCYCSMLACMLICV